MASWRLISRRIRVPMGFAFAVLFFWLAQPSVVSMLLGAVAIFAGLLIRALASGHVRKNEQLATTGPYAYTRNPLYLGSLVMAAGFAGAARSWWVAAAVLVFFLVIYVPVILGEEEFLRRTFPEFEDYVREVPRLLPRFWKGPVPGPGKPDKGASGFSWDLYRQHHEYNALVGALAMLAALAGKMIWNA